MNFWQRALKSVTRKKGRSLILFLVVFILGNVIAGAVAINQSTKNVEQQTKAKLGATATVELDYEKLNKDQEENPEKYANMSDAEMQELYSQPKLENYEAIGQLSYVKYYDYSLPAYMGTNKAKSYTTDEDGEISYGGVVTSSFEVRGVNRKEVVDVEEGKIKLVEGTTFSENDIQNGTNNVLISKEVAELNHVGVGDTLVFDVTGEQSNNGLMRMEGDVLDESGDVEIVSFDFPTKVIGIFTVIKKEETTKKSGEEQTEADWLALSQINTVYLPNKAVKSLSKEMGEKIWGMTEEELQEDYYLVTYVLNSPDDVVAFKEEAQPLIGKSFYKVIAATDQYDQIAGGMNKLSTISRYVVIVAVIASLTIITLVVLLFLRDRKHEMGIYLSLGEKRGRVMAQILLELLLISFAALLISMVTGNLLGSAVSNSLLQSEWLSQANLDSTIYYPTIGNNTITYEEIKQDYNVNFSLTYFVSYFVIGLGTILLSALVPLLYILRLNPKKIMM